jgi:hypothetical protein
MDVLPTLIDLAQKAGAFGCVFATLAWLSEKSERKELQKKYDALSERTANGLATTASAISDIKQILLARVLGHE